MQPQLIYIADSVIVFNANYWTNTAGDVEAVYYNPDAPDSAVMALRTTAKITLPHTAVQYPDTNYRVGATNSPSALTATCRQSQCGSRTSSHARPRGQTTAPIP